MKLIEALEIMQEEQPSEAPLLKVYLVCSFNPLHLQTFLGAQLRRTLPERRTEITAGLYGDFWGNLAKLKEENAGAGLVLMEWGDLDPRLGGRSLGSWAPEAHPEILQNAHANSARFLDAIRSISRTVPVVLCLPTLPLPPVSFTPTWEASTFDLELRALVASLRLDAVRTPGVKVLNPQQLDALSSLCERPDPRSELASGFPYQLSHASALAELLVRMIHAPVPKKGLITDLDDTLWSGILGEVGIDGVSWDLEHQSHLHGVYQRLVFALSKSGVLVGVASKNDPALVKEALKRKDMVLPEAAVFPVEAHWGPKSESVGRILKAWNIAADAVVFVDDSPLELAEVKAAHAGIQCIQFPKNDPRALQELLCQLRDLFGKSKISEEDGIRAESLRQAHLYAGRNGDQAGIPEQFLEQAEAEVSFNFSKDPLDARALELVNKTNQFNLNGKRHTEASWRKYLDQAETALTVAAYRDKYGPLGKIAVLAGRKQGPRFFLDIWVMSCRAFGRRIEYRCLEELFEREAVTEIVFDFQATPRNGPLADFLQKVLGHPPAANSSLARDRFVEVRPKMFHRVLEAVSG